MFQEILFEKETDNTVKCFLKNKDLFNYASENLTNFSKNHPLNSVYSLIVINEQEYYFSVPVQGNVVGIFSKFLTDVITEFNKQIKTSINSMDELVKRLNERYSGITILTKEKD